MSHSRIESVSVTGVIVPTRLIDGDIWPTSIMICRYCWQVELHSRSPKLFSGDELSDDDTILKILVVNQGDPLEMEQWGCLEEEED